MANARRQNEFMLTAFDDRQMLLQTSLANHTVDQLKDLVIALKRNSEIHRNNRFQNTLDTIIACVSFKRLCGTGVGKWLGDHYQNLDPRLRASITERCKLSAAIFMNWDTIVHNLTNSEMEDVDPRDFTLRKLYNARNISWCLREKKQNAEQESTKPPAVENKQEYDEALYNSVLNNIKDSGILQCVNHDSVQADLIAARIKSDLQKICKEAREPP
jgi:hypothetical protein